MLEALELCGPRWRTPAAFDQAEPLLAATREHGLEGVVAKRLDSPYAAGRRSTAWVRQKRLGRERATVIATRSGRELRYRGVVELGLDRPQLWQSLEPLEQPHCPLPWPRPPRGVTWVKPQVDVLVECHGRHGALRDAAVRAVCGPA